MGTHSIISAFQILELGRENENENLTLETISSFAVCLPCTNLVSIKEGITPKERANYDQTTEISKRKNYLPSYISDTTPLTTLTRPDPNQAKSGLGRVNHLLLGIRQRTRVSHGRRCRDIGLDLVSGTAKLALGQHIKVIFLMVEVAELQPEEHPTDDGQDGNDSVVPHQKGILFGNCQSLFLTT